MVIVPGHRCCPICGIQSVALTSTFYGPEMFLLCRTCQVLPEANVLNVKELFKVCDKCEKSRIGCHSTSQGYICPGCMCTCHVFNPGLPCIVHGDTGRRYGGRYAVW